MARRSQPIENAQLVVFDIGNTIVDANALIESSVNYAAKRFVDLGLIRDVHSLIQSYLEKSRELSHEHINRIFSDPLICTGALAAAELPCDEYRVYLFLTYFRNELRRQIKMDEDLVSLLQDLRERGLNLCALSDGTTIEQYELLERLGTLTLFDDIVISEAFGKEKTSTEIFEHILQRFGVRADQSVMIGDDIKRDMFWAHNAGYTTVLQEQFAAPALALLNEFESRIDYRVSSLTDIRELLLGAAKRDPLRGRFH